MRLSEIGEVGLLAELERRGLAQGIENDAAQVGELVVTQDALVECVHFRFDLIDWRELGYRAAAVNLSDLAASGAEPEALLVTLAVPSGAEVEDVVALYEGLNEPGVPVAGGDTSRSDRVLLSVTALGRSARVPGRAGAKPGDTLDRHRASRGRRRRVPREPPRASAAQARARAGSSPPTRTPCSTSPTGWPSTRAISRSDQESGA